MFHSKFVSRLPMKHSSRLYVCVFCHVQAVICSYCDRGQIYCSIQCSKMARRKSCRQAEKRYQTTLKGKEKHAARQKRYRMRQKQKVTDQGSLPTKHNVLLSKVKNKTDNLVVSHSSKQKQCCWCNKAVSAWFRNDFLRSYRANSNRKLFNLRPP